MTNLQAAVNDALEHALLTIEQTDDLWQAIKGLLEPGDFDLLRERINAIHIARSFGIIKP